MDAGDRRRDNCRTAVIGVTPQLSVSSNISFEKALGACRNWKSYMVVLAMASFFSFISASLPFKSLVLVLNTKIVPYAPSKS